MKHHFKQFILLILTIILLSACADETVDTTPLPPTEVVNATPEPIPTNTPSPTNTPLPEPTSEPTATIAPTETPQPSPTPVPQIAGIITDAVTGVGVADAFVEAIRVDSPGISYQTTTNEQGAYMFFEMESAEYAVRVIAEGYAYEFYDNVIASGKAEYLSVQSGQSLTNIDFDLNEGGSIAGFVYGDEGETAVSDAGIFVRPVGFEVDLGIYTETGADGSYIVSNLALGEYVVMVKHSNWIQQHFENVNSWDNADPVKVEPSQITNDIDFILEKGGSISGFVYEADGVTPVVDASVSAINTNERGEWLGDNTMTRVDGSYTIDHLVPYDYWVSVSKNGFGYQLYDGKFFEGEKDFVSVVAGENNSDINFILQPGGLLQIRYIDEENGEKIQQHIEVFVQDAFTQDRVTVAPVELWLNPGVYKINLGQGHPYLPEWYENAESYETATPIEIIAGETTSVEMILTPIGTITGVVYDQDGETPLADVSVFAFPISDDYPGAGANTDENGRYTIEGLASGSYRVAASLTGYQTLYFGDAVEEATATLVTVNAPDQTSDIDIILTPE